MTIGSGCLPQLQTSLKLGDLDKQHARKARKIFTDVNKRFAFSVKMTHLTGCQLSVSRAGQETCRQQIAEGRVLALLQQAQHLCTLKMHLSRSPDSLERPHEPPSAVVGKGIGRIANGMVQQRFDNAEDTVDGVLASPPLFGVAADSHEAVTPSLQSSPGQIGDVGGPKTRQEEPVEAQACVVGNSLISRFQVAKVGDGSTLDCERRVSRHFGANIRPLTADVRR